MIETEKKLTVAYRKLFWVSCGSRTVARCPFIIVSSALVPLLVGTRVVWHEGLIDLQKWRWIIATPTNSIEKELRAWTKHLLKFLSKYGNGTSQAPLSVAILKLTRKLKHSSNVSKKALFHLKVYIFGHWKWWHHHPSFNTVPSKQIYLGVFRLGGQLWFEILTTAIPVARYINEKVMNITVLRLLRSCTSV